MSDPKVEGVEVRPVMGGGIELWMEREYPVPRALVFDAWTKAEHFARWFGPRGSTLSPCTIDPRKGGEFHFRHRFEDYEDVWVEDVWVKGRYREFAAPERIVFTTYFSDPEGGRRPRPGFPDEMETDVRFEAVPGGTRLVIRQTGLIEDQGEVQGWSEALERLSDHLADADAGDADREIVMTREYDAPPAAVLAAWTEVDRLRAWWGPDGFSTTIHELDVRPGGRWRFLMIGPDGTEYPNRVVYREVDAPNRLVYEHGNDVEDDPHRFRVRVRFEEVAEGRTRLTMRLTFRTAEERDGKVGFGAVELGHQTLAKLAAHLGSA